MDWEFVFRHFMSGCIPATCGMALYALMIDRVGRKQRLAHGLTAYLLCLYFVGLLTVTGICIRGSFSPRFSFIPFVDMIRGPIDTVLNIILFVPLGFLLPILYKKLNTIGKATLAGFVISLSVEVIQIFGFGATDINDLITNTFGTYLGCRAYSLVSGFLPDSWKKQVSTEGTWCFAELLLLWVCAIVMMLSIQPKIYKLLYTHRV